MSLKRNIKVLGALAAVLAFSAFAASSALAANDAPRYTITGYSPETPVAGELFHIKGTGTGSTAAGNPGLLEVPGLFTLTNPADGCTITGKIEGSNVDQPGTITELTLTCTGVMYEGALDAVCVLHSPGAANGTVITNELHGKLVWLAQTGHTHVGVTISPASTVAGATFATLQVTHKPGTGEVCPVVGNFPITGSIIGTIENPTVHEETQKIEFTNPPVTGSWTNATPRVAAAKDELKVGGKVAQFTNTFDITISEAKALDKLWGVETG